MHIANEDYLTVSEAAALLRVAASTIRRWIRQGDIPAYRVGPRRIALKRTDVNAKIAPARTDSSPNHYVIHTDPGENRKLTPEEVQRALEALERGQRHVREIMQRRGGVPLRPTLEIIHEMREERLRELG